MLRNNWRFWMSKLWKLISILISIDTKEKAVGLGLNIWYLLIHKYPHTRNNQWFQNDNTLIEILSRSWQVSTVTKSRLPCLIFFFVSWILKAKQSVKEENAETLFAGRKTKISRKVILRYLTYSTIDKTN